jgi:hypothetical protein
MPPTSSAQSEHSRRRMKAYFSGLQRDRDVSKNKIGALVDVNSFRVSEWTSGRRLMSPEKAFDLGTALRSEFGWPTSGVEFLWACGYWSDVLSIIKHLAADGHPRATDSAIMLYCWLPLRMLEFEHQEITARLRDKHGIDDAQLRYTFQLAYPETSWLENLGRPDLLKQVRDLGQIDPGAGEIQRYYLDNSTGRYDEDGNLEELRAELEFLCRTDAFQNRIERAWQSYYNGELDSRAIASRVGTSEAIGLFELHIIDALIEASRKLNDVMHPSYAVPRIWRMSAAWIYDIDEEAAHHWIPTLPDNFVNVPEARTREEAHLRALEMTEEEQLADAARAVNQPDFIPSLEQEL